MNKKRILVVCQHYYPENFQVTDICEELVKQGYEVTALVGLPNYPEGYVLDKYKHHKNRDEYINGVHVIRCFEIGRRKNVLFLGLNYLSFWFSSLLKVNSLDQEFDIVLGYETSPITMVDAARKYAKKYNKPFYLFCVDIWPECLKVYIKSEKNPIFKVFRKISKKIYESADLTMCSSESFIDYLYETHNIDKNKLTYLPQFGDDSLLEEDFTPIDNEIIDFVYTGNVGKQQNLEYVLECLNQINDFEYKIHIVGDGSDLENVKKKALELNMSDKVVFYGKRPKEEMKKFYKIADMCIVSSKDDTKIGLTLPNKLINYLAAGKPILGFISGDGRKVIEDNNCGICIENDLSQLSISTLHLCEFISNKDVYLKKFSKNIVLKELLDLIK